MFKRKIGNSSIFGGVIMDENPQHRIQREISKQVREESRKKVEDISEKIHPIVGQAVRTMNNLNDTKENFEDSLENGFFRSLFSKEVEDLQLADHLFVQRFGYTHHGIYIGNGKVIHYLRECVREDTLEVFADGAKIHKKLESESYISYSKSEAINRAYSRCYEDNYNLFKNNCESFVRWCRNGGEMY